MNGEVTIDQMTEHEARKTLRRAACIAIGGFTAPARLDRIEGWVAVTRLGTGIEGYEKIKTDERA